MNPTTCKSCGLPIFHGPAGYAGPQCMCRWTNAAQRQPEGDRLEVVAYQSIDATRGGGWMAHKHALPQAHIDQGALQEPLCRLSDAQRAIAELREEISDLHTTMMAAAVEIQEHWQAHCDEEGYGPANLMYRLERGIASQYGYTAQTLVQLEAERDTLRQQLAERDAQIASMRAEVTQFIETHWRSVERQRDKLADLLQEVVSEYVHGTMVGMSALVARIDATLDEVK